MNRPRAAGPPPPAHSPPGHIMDMLTRQYEPAIAGGIGAALLLACLRDMRSLGHIYAVVGAVGAPEFFRRVAGATEIEGSTPGLYGGMLRR